MRHVFLFLLAWAMLQDVCAQAPADSLFLRFEGKYREMGNARGMPAEDIDKTLKRYHGMKIWSDDDFAGVLSGLFRSGQQIGVLLYFYERDTLYAKFFAPGRNRKVEELRTAVSIDSLVHLAQQLREALNLDKARQGRVPEVRGIRPPARDPLPALSLDSATALLSRLLLPPALDSSYRHLMIIPCLNLGALPFALLRCPGDRQLLIDRCSISMAPTLVDFLYLRGALLEKSSNWDGSLFTERYFFEKEARLPFERPLFVCNPMYPDDASIHFPNLPGAEREIDSALRYASSYRLLKGASATKPAVLKAMSGSDVVYFATHGMADEVQPMERSYLVLSGKDPYLTSREIQNLRYDSTYQAPALVILSACQTGLGRSMEGGIAGSLARSFLISGSLHVVQSLWNVDDDATAYLMSRLLYYLNEGARFLPAGALRLAMLDTRRRYPSPAYWASFCTIGADY
ncbi:MAG: CHAT domain-containing protein [Chitinophagaceae bacterium]|nr:MAG: CHAT domain-containing protein [Chitinophagaceae bacterium]